MTDLSGGRCAKRSFYILLCLVLLLSVHLRHPAGTYAQEKTSVKKGGKIQLNFVDVDITTVANFISKITGKNFIYDDRVTGKVTIVAPTRIDVEEAFDLFTSVLELKGYSTVFTGTAYKIVPSGGIKQDPMKVVSNGFRVNDSYIARLIPLAFIQSQDILPMIQPLISREGYVAAFGRGNALLVIDSALNVEKILNIIKLVDVEPRGFTPEVVYLKYGQAEAIAQTLRQIRPGSRQSMTKMTPQPPAGPEGSGPVADKRLNALILFGSPEENAEYKRLIDILDVAPPEARSKINVYYLENAESSEIAKVLEGIIKPAGPATPPPGAPGVPPMAEFAGRIAITPDKASNSLIIMASPEDYQNIVQVIKKLDRRPSQVFVEAMIAEVSIDKTLNLGANWRAAATSHGKPLFIGGVGTIDSTAIQNIVSGMTGFSLGGVANFLNIPVTQPDGTVTTLNVPGFAALFNLSEFRDVVNVLSTPHILTSDNKEAEIMVGENVPFLSQFQASTTLGAPPIQSIDRKDVGITLRIKPQISEGNYIKLDIYQEISALVPTATTGVTATDIITTKRSAKTSVVVKDKQTVVIGGLIQNKETKNISKVPILGDIPLLGWLFKSTTTENTKTNVLVYLTPTIVKDFENLEDLKERKKEEFEKNSLEIEKEKK